MQDPGHRSDREQPEDLWSEDFLLEKGHRHRVVHALGSDVRIDEDAGVVSKRYRPRLLVRLLYRLAFQAPFPYRANAHALRAAELRRDIADLVLQHEIAPGLVARPHAHPPGVMELDSDFVQGTEPVDREDGRRFLREVSAAFRRAGLPVWQVAPWQPHAITNIIAKPGGGYEIIDLESNFVTPYVPLGQVGQMLSQGLWPVFDDINLVRLRRYIADREDALRLSLKAEEFEALAAAVDEYEEEAAAWHGSELRLLPRLARALYRVVTFPWAVGRWIGGIRRSVQHVRDNLEWDLERNIARWEDEGRLDEEGAAAAREQARSPAVMLALTHFAILLVVSVPLRFPLGSIARFAWVLVHRVKAEVLWLTGRREKGRLQRSVHGLPVLAIAGVPGFGAFAYAASPALRRNLVLVQIVADSAGHALPLHLYERLRLDSVVTMGHHRAEEERAAADEDA